MSRHTLFSGELFELMRKVRPTPGHRTVRILGGAVLDFIFPPLCLVCDLPLLDAERNAESRSRGLFCAVCTPDGRADLLFRRPPHGAFASEANSHIASCVRCGEVTTGAVRGEGTVCLLCELAPLIPGSLRSRWHFAGEVEEALKAYKYRNKRRLAPYLAEELLALIADEQSSPGWEMSWNLIVPLPSSRAMVVKRGFHHTGGVARLLGRRLRIPVDPFLLDATRSRQPQAQLRPAERRRNMQGVFAANRARVEGRSVLLVDDVITSGATLAEAGRALTAAGARDVDAITLARSPQFIRHRLAELLGRDRPRRKKGGAPDNAARPPRDARNG